MKQLLKTVLRKLGLLTWIKRMRQQHPEISSEKVVGTTTSGIDFFTVNSKETFDEYTKEHVEAFAKRKIVDQMAKQVSNNPYYVKGSNFLLPSGKGLYYATGSTNLREGFVCVETGLNNRVRATLYAISQMVGLGNLKNQSIYLTEAVTDLSRWFENHAQHITTSEFLDPQMESGRIINGIQHQDITRLSFADQTFDLSVCLEVLEHVPDYLKAFSELARVTKVGGRVFITVPFIEKNEQTVIRASFDQRGELIHHLPPEYHGDPVNEQGGILCFQHFGWDMLGQLKTAGFSDVKVHLVWSASELMLDRHIMVFEAIR